jgi:hypothetical protein
MHPDVMAFVEDLQANPPTDLATWLARGPEAKRAHLKGSTSMTCPTRVMRGAWQWPRKYSHSQKFARQQECFDFYGATRRPEVPLGEVCPHCFTERSSGGACFC